MDVARRDLIKMAGVAAVGAAVGNFGGAKMSEAKSSIKLTQAPVIGSKNVTGTKYNGTAAKVYFTKKIDAESLIKMYDLINGEIYGKVGIKLHTGEPHGPNIIPIAMAEALQKHVPDSKFIETNTLYTGGRYTTADHLETLKTNGWNVNLVDIMDADGYVDFPVRGGKHFQKIEMGKKSCKL